MYDVIFFFPEGGYVRAVSSSFYDGGCIRVYEARLGELSFTKTKRERDYIDQEV